MTPYQKLETWFRYTNEWKHYDGFYEGKPAKRWGGYQARYTGRTVIIERCPITFNDKGVVWWKYPLYEELIHKLKFIKKRQGDIIYYIPLMIQLKVRNTVANGKEWYFEKEKDETTKK